MFLSRSPHILQDIPQSGNLCWVTCILPPPRFVLLWWGAGGGLQGERPGLGTLPVGWYVAVLGENGAGEGVNSGLCSHVISKELFEGAAGGGDTQTHTHAMPTHQLQ